MCLDDKVYWGLEGVRVAETSICYIDVSSGNIYYRGYNVIELAENACYEEVAYLLIFGRLPRRDELSRFKRVLSDMRDLDDQIVDLIRELAPRAHPLDILRLALAYYCAHRRVESALDRESNLSLGLEILAKMPTIIAYTYRISNNLPIVRPRADLDHVSNFLYMLYGREPLEIEYKTMNSLFIVYADHGMANSTFTAISTASTLSDMCSALISAISSSKGPLHAGACSESVKMLLEIERVGDVESYVRRRLERNEKIMGFGHRVYKRAVDPRSVYFKKVLMDLIERTGNDGVRKLYHIANALEHVVAKYKMLYPNVDLYGGLIMYALGLPPDMNSAVFVAARAAGWIAHVIEYWSSNKLIRPTDKYVGPVGLKYVPIDER